MTLSRIAFVVALSTGCASVGHETRAPEGAERVASSSPTAAEARAGAWGAPANAARPSSEALRHFYLLSPGPNATLVVTRSDLPTR